MMFGYMARIIISTISPQNDCSVAASVTQMTQKEAA